MTSRWSFDRDALRFDVLDDGPPDGAPVVLLHGFPQDSTAWSEVTPLLVAAGMRVLAPDLRGYSPGARPTGRPDYRLSVLVGDVMTLLDAAGLESAHLVGHDWGGGLAWAVAMRRPERVRSLTVLSTPHPTAMAWATRHSTQGLRSWYMLAMQVPVLPELVLRPAIAAGGLSRLGLPAEHTRAYRQRLLQPGALRGAIGWYRALLTRRPRRGGPAPRAASPSSGGTKAARVSVPTTYVWGRHDPYLGEAAALRTVRYVEGDYRFVSVDADHWLPEKHARVVADEIIERVRSSVPTRRGPDTGAGPPSPGGGRRARA